MEFFRIIDKQITEEIIQHKITPKTMDLFAESMFFIKGNDCNFNGSTLWGEFNMSFHKIKGGVRFMLLDCPNALTWTITTGYPPERTKVVLHCTINRTQKPDEFVEEINEFLEEWEKGLLENL
ncbi:hypothetical protein [Lutibacter sp.]